MFMPHSSHDWLGRFSLSLMRLRPHINWPQAVTRAVRAYGHAAHQPPEEAARSEAVRLERLAHAKSRLQALRDL